MTVDDSKEDLQTLLEDPAYFDAYFNTMPQALAYHEAIEQKMCENVELAGSLAPLASRLSPGTDGPFALTPAEKSEAMKPDLERLREDTARLFNEANELKQRWAYLDDAQREAHKVRLFCFRCGSLRLF